MAVALIVFGLRLELRTILFLDMGIEENSVALYSRLLEKSLKYVY